MFFQYKLCEMHPLQAYHIENLDFWEKKVII